MMGKLTIIGYDGDADFAVVIDHNDLVTAIDADTDPNDHKELVDAIKDYLNRRDGMSHPKHIRAEDVDIAFIVDGEPKILYQRYT